MASYLRDGCYCCGDLITNELHADTITAKTINADEIHYETVSYDELDANTINVHVLNADEINCENINYDNLTTNNIQCQNINVSNEAVLANGFVDTGTINNATITTETVGTANINTATIGTGTITTGTITNLSSNEANITSLTATNISTTNQITANDITTESVNTESINTTTIVSTSNYCSNLSCENTIDSVNLRTDDIKCSDLSARSSITLAGDEIHSWSDISGGGSSSGIVLGDGIIGNDLISSTNNSSCVYSNYKKTEIDNVIKHTSNVFTTASREAEGYTIYSSMNKSLFPYSKIYWNTSTSLNNVIENDSSTNPSTEPNFLLNTVMPDETDLFNIEHKGIYSYYNKSTLPQPSLSNYISDVSVGKMLGSIRDYATWNGKTVEYIIVFFQNISIYCVQRPNTNVFSPWMTLFNDDGNISVKNYNYHFCNACRWKQRNIVNCGGFGCIVRSDIVESTTNGFMFYLFEGEIITNTTYNQPQLKLYSRVITSSNFSGNGYSYTIDLQRDCICFRAANSWKIFIMGYIYSNTHGRVERACCSCYDNQLNFANDEWCSLPDEGIDLPSLTIHSQIRSASFDNGAIIVGDYMTNTFDVAIFPPNFNYPNPGESTTLIPAGRICYDSLHNHWGGCFIGSLSINPFIPEVLDNTTIANRYYFIVFNTYSEQYECFKITNINTTAPYWFRIEQDTSIDLSFCSFSDIHNNWYLYYINWSVDTPFAIYKNDYVNTTEEGAEYCVARLDVKIYDWMKNNVCFINKGDYMPLNV